MDIKMSQVNIGLKATQIQLGVALAVQLRACLDKHIFSGHLEPGVVAHNVT
jgi:hypothetical protein